MQQLLNIIQFVKESGIWLLLVTSLDQEVQVHDFMGVKTLPYGSLAPIGSHVTQTLDIDIS